DTEDAITLERARAIAQAELDLARVRRAKLALIERASAFGEPDPPRLTVTQMIRLLHPFDRGRLILPKPVASSATSKSLTVRLRQADGSGQNWASWTATSAALLCGAIELCSISLVE